MSQDSHRSYDVNGYVEIKDNPISKVGVFEYSGQQINSDLEPNKIYKVYRPAEELADPECISSFRLLPFIDDHAMLGAEADGFLPPEQKGVHGVIGEHIYFDETDGKLKANLRIFSEKLSELIESGKKDLSIGYRCVYDLRAGVHEGQAYDAIQRQIRGNHVALVVEGRSGPDVAVLDHFRFTFDAKRLSDMQETTPVVSSVDEPSISEVLSRIAKLEEMVAPIIAARVADNEAATAAAANAVGDSDENEAMEKEEKAIGDEDVEKKITSMDAKLGSLVNAFDHFKTNGLKEFTVAINKRNELAEKASHFIGVFDHSSMSVDDVARYALKELKITCDKGQEQAMLAGYLAAASVPARGHTAIAADAAPSSLKSFINKHIEGV